MSIQEAMKSQITLGTFLSILVPCLVIILSWTISIEVRFTEQNIRITNNERINNTVLNKIDQVIREVRESDKVMTEQLTDIKVALENKQNRD